MHTIKFRVLLLLIVLIYFFISSFFNVPKEVFFNVTASNNYQLKNIPIKNYQNAYVLPQGKMTINNLTKFQRWIAPEISGNDVVQLFFIIVYLLIIAIWLFKLNIEKPFLADISKAIKLLGYGIIALSFIIYIRDGYFSKLISSYSTNEFSLPHNNSLIYSLAISLVCNWLSKAYKKANKLEKENALTI
jgi:hypothetical protein